VEDFLMPTVLAGIKVAVAAVAAYFKAHAVVAFFAKVAAVYAISRAVAPRQSVASLRAMATEVNVRDPAAPRQIIYGQRRVSGVLYPVGTSGTNNEYLHVLLLIAGHECEELGTVYFNDEEIPLDGSGNATGRFAGYVRIKKHLGAYNQTVDTDLQTDLGATYWPSTMKLGGIAHLYLRLKVSADMFGGGLPELWCLTKGRKVYDSRDGAQSATNAATWTWSANAALCLTDWLRGVPTRNSAGTIVRNFGLGAADAEIDYTAVAAAANICDENVVLDDASTEDRYTANGVIQSSVRAGDGIDLIKSAMAGDCVPVGGLWTIYAGAYRTPTVTLDDGDLRSPLTGVRLKPSRRELCNVVRGLYVSPLNAWQVADFPEVKNATYKTQDGGEELPASIELQFTTSAATAQRLAKIVLERSRQGQAFVARCKLTAFEVKAGDVVQWTNARLGWSAKPFEVLATALVVEDDANGNPYIGVDLTVRETASGVWDWADGEETVVDLAPNTDLPDPFTVAAPTGMTVTSSAQGQADGTVNPRLLIAWTAPADAYVTSGGRIRVQYKLHSDSEWLNWSLPKGDEVLEILTAILIGSAYDVRIRAENQLDVASAWVTVNNTTAAGDTTAPTAPANVAVALGTGKSLSVSWDASPEPDVREYAVNRGTTSVFVDSAIIATVTATRFVDTTVTIGTRYWYWIRPVDFSGNMGPYTSPGDGTPAVIAATATDGTAPGTPAAFTLSTTPQTPYLSTDGTVVSRFLVDLPAMPTLGVQLNLLIKRSDQTNYWLAGSYTAGSVGVPIDDVTPGLGYDIAVQAISAFGIGSTLRTITGGTQTAPGDTTAPSAPTSIAYVSGSDSNYGRPARFQGVVRAFSIRANWTAPTAKDLDHYEWVATSDSDAAADAASKNISYETEAILSSTTLGAIYFRVRAIDRSGNASAWAGGGTSMATVPWGLPGGNAMEKDVGTASGTVAAGNDSRIVAALQNSSNLSDVSSSSSARSNLGLGTLATQNANAASVTAIKVGGGASNSDIKVIYSDTIVKTFTGGSPSEVFTIDLTNRGFAAKADVGLVQCYDPNYLSAYNFDHASNSSTTAYCTLVSRDGSNIPGSASARFSVIFADI
jgi:hypothetical protein